MIHPVLLAHFVSDSNLKAINLHARDAHEWDLPSDAPLLLISLHMQHNEN